MFMTRANRPSGLLISIWELVQTDKRTNGRTKLVMWFSTTAISYCQLLDLVTRVVMLCDLPRLHDKAGSSSVRRAFDECTTSWLDELSISTY